MKYIACIAHQQAQEMFVGERIGENRKKQSLLNVMPPMFGTHTHTHFVQDMYMTI